MAYCLICGQRHDYPLWGATRYQYGYYLSFISDYLARTRQDDEIQRDVQDYLFWDTWVNSRRINVEVENGVVTLSGTVRMPAEKKAAEDDAWDVPGVKDVKNILAIEGRNHFRIKA